VGPASEQHATIRTIRPDSLVLMVLLHGQSNNHRCGTEA